jgi:hypothetical protein
MRDKDKKIDLLTLQQNRAAVASAAAAAVQQRRQRSDQQQRSNTKSQLVCPKKKAFLHPFRKVTAATSHNKQWPIAAKQWGSKNPQAR